MPGDKKNLVLGTAIGYGVPEISIFVKSFREYTRIDEVMLVVDSSISIDVINFCIAHNIKYTPFEAYKFIPTHIQNSRYIKYLEILLDNIMRYDKVFLSDVRDVVFQGDIFDDLPEQFLYYFMEYEGGRIAELSSSCKAFAPHSAMIVGTKGYIEVPNFFYPQEFYIVLSNGKRHRIGAPYKVNGYVHEAVEAIRCVREGLDESPVMPASKTLEILKIMDTIRRQWKLQYPGEKG